MKGKDLVAQFYEEVFNGGNLEHLESYMKEDYIQHNPNVEDGREGFRRFAAQFLAKKPKVEIVHIGEDNDIVYVFFKCTMGDGTVNKVCDIYRIEDGMIAEHWDVVEHHMEGVQPVHKNGLF